MDEAFREGIINLNTRQFGKVVELIVTLIKDYKTSTNLDFDLYDSKRKRHIEVKSSRVFKKNKLDFKLNNLYNMIINNTNKNRLLKTNQVKTEKFDCNIQQVKAKLFDELYYLLFFYDRIEIFLIKNKQIKKDKKLKYSDKQHKGNIGEGQFHINQDTYEHHKKKYFIEAQTYTQIKRLLLRHNKTM